MPFVFVHGVAVRDESAVPGIARLLRHYVAPVFSANPESVELIPAFWGDLAAKFAWDEASLPLHARGHAVAQGAVPGHVSFAAEVTTLALSGAELARDGDGLLGPMSATKMGPGVPVESITADEASDLFAGALALEMSAKQDATAVAFAADSDGYAALAIALDQAIHDIAAGQRITMDEATIARIEAAADRQVGSGTRVDVASQGIIPQRALDAAGRRVAEAIQTARDRAGDMAAMSLIGLRQPLNHFVTMFTGDVFTYLQRRDDLERPQSIIRRVTDALEDAARKNNGEPIVVLSHSMGGQLIYDTITHYLEVLSIDVKIDFWATAASQVGLFEEMKLLKASLPKYSAANKNKVPLPVGDHLGAWWNVFDTGDWLSYTAEPIFEGVNESQFRSDASPLQAHGAYLVMPRFYRMFAAELKKALR